MGLPNYWQGTRGIMPLLIIRFVCCLGWFSSFAFAQFDISQGVTGSVNYFSSLGITCIANLAVFVTSLIRQWIDLDIGASYFIDILSSPKLKKINGMNGHGLTTTENLGDAAVVMLSNGAPNSSMTEFMESNANRVNFILLQYFSVRSTAVEIETCSCWDCDCIVFYTVKEITMMLALRMPGTLKLLSDGLCLLPCVKCLEKGCHGCTEESVLRVEGPLPVEQSHDGYRLREPDSKVVCGFLHWEYSKLIDIGWPICICIPMKDARSDEWTKLLVKSLRSKDAEGRGVRDDASHVLENYLAGAATGFKEGWVKYNIASFIMTRLTEVSINLLLTFFLGVDGFSSAVVARRIMRDYLVDSKGSGFTANAFLTKVRVRCNDNNTQVWQMLRFRGNIVGMRTMSIIVGCVNLVCSLGWTVLIALKGSADISPPLLMPRVAVIIAAIGIILCMDLAVFFECSIGLFWSWRVAGSGLGGPLCTWPFSRPKVFVTVIILEIVCIVSGSVVAGTLGAKAFDRWVYGVMQALVWVKWGLCCYLLHYGHSYIFYFSRRRSYTFLVGSSAFFLNAVLAGVRCKWEPGPWKFDSRKFGPGGNGN